MLTVAQIIGKLEDRNLSEVARRAGVLYPALRYFATHKGGTRVDMRMMEKLSNYLECEREKNTEGE